MPQTIQPPNPASLTGTLDQDQVLSQLEAQQNAQQAWLAQRSQAAQNASEQASQAYQQAASQPAQTLGPQDLFIPTLLSGIVSTLTQDKGAARERAQTQIKAQQENIDKARTDNLVALRDLSQQKADLARRAGDIEAQTKAHNDVEKFSKQLDLLNQKHLNDLALENQRAANRMAELNAKAATAGSSPDDVQATYENSVRTDMAGNRYIDTGQFKGKDLRAIQAEAARRGDLALSTPQSNVLTKIDDAKQNIKTVYDSVAQFAPKDFLGRPMKAAQIKWSQLVQSDPEAASYSALQLAAINNIVAIAGGAGSGVRVNEAEIRRSIANDMPRPTDTIPVALRKTQHMDEMLEHLRNTVVVRNRSTLAGGAPVSAPVVATSTKVKMRAPDGKLYSVDSSESAEAQKNGWKVVR